MSVTLAAIAGCEAPPAVPPEADDRIMSLDEYQKKGPKGPPQIKPSGP
jgi:hypothetical protein